MKLRRPQKSVGAVLVGMTVDFPRLRAAKHIRHPSRPMKGKRVPAGVNAVIISVRLVVAYAGVGGVERRRERIFKPVFVALVSAHKILIHALFHRIMTTLLYRIIKYRQGRSILPPRSLLRHPYKASSLRGGARYPRADPRNAVPSW